MIAVAEWVLDTVIGLTEPRANENRLAEARRKFGDNELVRLRIGRQTFLLPESTVKVLRETGMLSQLAQGAQRGDQLDTIYQE